MNQNSCAQAGYDTEGQEPVGVWRGHRADLASSLATPNARGELPAPIFRAVDIPIPLLSCFNHSLRYNRSSEIQV